MSTTLDCDKSCRDVIVKPRIDLNGDLSWACSVMRKIFVEYAMIYPHFTPHIIKHGGFIMSGSKGAVEVLGALSGMVDIVSEVMADGKVTLGDMSSLPALFMDLKAAVEGVAAVKDEYKDYSHEDMKVIVGAVVELALKIGGKFK